MEGTVSDDVVEFWEDFCRAREVDSGERYQVWYFGNTPEMAAELAELVMAGTKTATASLSKTNELMPETAPVENGYSVVTDFRGRPMCVVRTSQIREMAFDDVDEQFAYDEGEGDRSLEYWRKVHWAYYTVEAARLGFEFDEKSIVCCERFLLLHRR